MASGSGWNLWVWLLGVVVRRYTDFIILLICICSFFSSIPTFCSFLKNVIIELYPPSFHSTLVQPGFSPFSFSYLEHCSSSHTLLQY